MDEFYIWWSEMIGYSDALDPEINHPGIIQNTVDDLLEPAAIPSLAVVVGILTIIYIFIIRR